MVARSYRRLLAAAPAGETFNICSERSNSLAEVIDLCAEIAGYRIDVQVNPAFVRANDVLTLSGSNEKLARVIGPLDPPALIDTLRWMLEGMPSTA
jgi:UDP-glucose 4-epimerase